MKAIVVKKYGGPEVLEMEEVAKPSPAANQVLIKIKATSITAASTFMREGKPYLGRLFTGIKKPKSPTPGTDLSGIVEEVGSSVTKFKIGDVVMAETGLESKAYAEYICLEEDDLIVHQPENLTAEEATGILDGGSTALAFFTDSVSLRKGQKVLINGASGSIGTAAVQLAKQAGAEVTAVCSGRNKALVQDLGADVVLDYTKNELESTNRKFDVVFDTVGKLSFKRTKKFMNAEGVFLTPVMNMPTLVSMFGSAMFGSKKLKFSATGMRNKSARMRDLVAIRDMMAKGKLTTVVDRVYPFGEIQEAARYVDQGHKRGNVVVSFQN